MFAFSFKYWCEASYETRTVQMFNVQYVSKLINRISGFVWSLKWGGESGPQCCCRFMLSNLLPTQHSPQPGESSHLPHTPPTHTYIHTQLCVVSACTPITPPTHTHQHPFSMNTHTRPVELPPLYLFLYPSVPSATSSPISCLSVQMFRLTTATTLNKHHTALSCSTNCLNLPQDTLAHPQTC